MSFADPTWIAFGTWPLTGDVLARAIADALAAGYRHFDTAQMYANEADTGAALRAALRAADLPRDALHIATKVHPENYASDRFLASVEASVAAIGQGPVDLLLLHWPPRDSAIEPPLKLLAETQRAGLARAIGISNFTAEMMHRARDTVDLPILTNQVEFHPLLDQRRLLAAAEETGIPLSAHCPLARGAALGKATIVEIAAEAGATPAQTVLAWTLSKGVSPVTSSTRAANLAANLGAAAVALTPAQIARIDALGAEGLRCVDAARSPWAPDWD